MIGTSMDSDAWFPCYPADLISNTSRLSPHDFGAYWRLLCDYYQNGPLPNDDEDLCRISTVQSADWMRTKGKVIAVFFELGNDNCWHQDRADEIIAERKELVAKKRAQTAAARAANPKHQIVTEIVTNPITEDVANDVTILQSKSKSKVQSKVQVHPDILNKGIEAKKFSGQTKTFRALQLANRIVGNTDSWHWDNCKIPIVEIKARSLASVIEPHVDKPDISMVWHKAAVEAHAAVVDGLPKAVRDPVGYAVACFKARLAL